MIPWYVLVLISATILAGSNIIRKYVLNYEHSSEQLAAEGPFRLILLLAFVPFIDVPSQQQYAIIIAGAVLLYVAMLYRNKAYRHHQISSIAPLQNLSPLFLMILAAATLHEFPTGKQLFGVAFLVFGSVALTFNKQSPLGPLRTIFEKSKVKMIFILLISVSILALLDRYALYTLAIPVITYVFWVHLLYTIMSMSTHYMLYGTTGIKQDWKKGSHWLFLIAVLSIIDVMIYFSAIRQPAALIAVAVPLRRSATLIETVLGGRLFNEEGLVTKMLSCGIMIIGIILLV